MAQAEGTLRGRGPRYILKKPVESNGRSRIPVLSLLQRARRGSRPQSGHKGVQSGLVSKVAAAVAAPNSNRPLSSCAPGRVLFATAGYLTLAWVAQD